MGNQHLPGEEVWLVGEHRSTGERKHYLANLAAGTPIKKLAGTIKARWICEQAHQQLKEELGLDDSNIMHAEEEYAYFRPIIAGDAITVTHAIADIYDKQTPTGKLVYVVLETRGNDAKGRPVFKGRRVLVELKRD